MRKPFTHLVILSFFFLLLSPKNAFSQLDTAQIVGPGLVCMGECATYFLEGLSPNCPPTGQWYILTPNGGVINLPGGGTNATIVICWDQMINYQPGQYTIVAAFDCQINVIPLEVTVVDFYQPDIIAVTNNACGQDSLGATSDCMRACAFSTITYTVANASNPPGGPPVFWTVSGAESFEIDGNFLTVTWGAAGTGYIGVFINSICPGEGGLCVEILPDPEAAFTTQPPSVGGVVSICEGQTVYFENQSLGADTYGWFFDVLGVSTQTDPEFAFQTPGAYEVWLVARNECGCSDTTSLLIQVEAAETPVIDCAGAVCAGEVVTYTTSANCSSFGWNVNGSASILGGGGSADNFITIEWLDGPVGYIELDVTSCATTYCSATLVEQIPVLNASAAISGPQEVCLGETALYSIPEYDGSGYSWTVSGQGQILAGQGTNQIRVRWDGPITNGLTQWVQVDYDNCFLECSGSATLPVGILNEFYTSGPIVVCEGETASYTAQNVYFSTSNTWNWEVQETNGTVLWSSATATAAQAVNWTFGPGKYRLVATTTNPALYCLDSYAIVVDVRALSGAPNAIDGPDLVCPGTSYTYSVNTGQPNSSFSWTIHNGGVISTDAGPAIVVTWGPAPPYELEVTQTQPGGPACPSPAVSLTAQPLAGLNLNGPAEVCVENTSIFSVADNGTDLYQWTITPADAGTVLTGAGTATVEILWHSAGPATVEVSVCGLSASANIDIQPQPAPDPLFPAGVCNGETAQVSTQTIFSAYQWLDESGALVSTAPDPQLGPGAYQVVVTNAAGCEGSASFIIEEYPIPEVYVSTPDPTGYCAGHPPATLYATTTGSGFSYQWYYNGAPVGTNATSLVDLGYGNYWVEATNVDGCTTTSNILEVFEYCPPGGGTCGGGGGLPGGGGGGIPTNCLPGTSIQFQILPPTANCAEGVFENLSPDLVPGSLVWSFGDGAGSTDQGPVLNHFYAQAGFYDVVLAGVSLSTGEVCWDSHILTIPAAAGFYAGAGCEGSPIQFEDRSTYIPTASIASWDWDFGDGNSSNLASPAHAYVAAGTYNVTLTITAQSGCQSSITQQVEVYSPPAVGFDLPQVTCEGTPLPFDATLPGNVVSVEWDFGDPASGSANTSVSASTFHDFSAPGSYDVALTATSIYGCVNSLTQNIQIDPNGLGGLISSVPDPPQVCEGDMAALTAPAGGVSWLWSNGQTTASVNVLEEAVYTVTLTDAQGCQYTPDPVSVDVAPGPDAVISAVEFNEYGQPVGIFYNAYSTCEGEDVNLQIEGAPGNTYVWSNGVAGNTVVFADWRNNPLTVGAHDITVVVTDQTTGCTSTIGPFTVTVNPNPGNFVIDASNSPACSGQASTLSVPNPDPTLTYVWTTGETGPDIEVVLPGVYNVAAINMHGCRRESDTPVTVEPGPYLGAIPSGCHTQCNPDTICLPDLPNVVSYQWYVNGVPVPGPEGNAADLPIAQSGVYVVEMVDELGCTAASGPLSIDLYDGYGTIFGNVYMDVNQNGLIDGPDTLVQGVGVELWENGVLVAPVVSGTNGAYSFANILSTGYTVQLDTTSFPPGATYLQSWQTDTDLVGCDDEEQVDWLLSPDCNTQDSITLIACENNPVIFDGIWIPSGSIVVFEYTNTQGCDSVIVVNALHVKVDTIPFLIEICLGDSAFYNGQQVWPDSTTDFEFTGWLGCDSIVRVTVMEFMPQDTILVFNSCDGMPIDYNAQFLLPGSTTLFNYQTSEGCDSLVTVTVLDAVSDTTQVEFIVCENEFSEYNGQQLPPGSVTSFPHQGADGCDSLVIVTVTGLSVSDPTEVLLEACEGESVEYNGQMLAAGSITTFPFSNIFGCDSIVTVTVLALDIDTVQVELEVCPGETITYLGQQFDAGDEAEVILTNIHGCDSVVQVTVTGFPQVVWESASSPSCWNTATGSMEVDIQQGDGAFLLTLNGDAGGPSFGPLGAGSYALQITDVHGCLHEATVVVTQIPPLAPVIEAEPWECKSGSASVFAALATGQGEITWPDGTKGSFWDAPAPGIFSVVFENECETLTRTFEVIYAEDEVLSPLYFPNIFSPNADGINDTFRGYAAEGVEIRSYQLLVFDRWGNLLFETETLEEGWDGRFEAEELDPAVFAYYVRATLVVCGQVRELFKEGDVTLIR